jgi:L-ascorbate 6-phosphate lactonase
MNQRTSRVDHQGFVVPPRSITLWRLGQAGFLIKSPDGARAVLDPYLSDSCAELGRAAGFNMNRMIPPPMTPQELVGVNLFLLTHSHQDHAAPETILPYLEAGGKATFVAPLQTAQKLRRLDVDEKQIYNIQPSQKIDFADLSIAATFAVPFAGDDLTHVGYLVSVTDGPSVYFTGDTAYEDILHIALVDRKPDVLVAVVNGAFRNMSPADAAKLAKYLNPKHVVPCHHDLFPDNSLPAELLRTNLAVLGLANRFLPLEYGKPFTFCIDR